MDEATRTPDIPAALAKRYADGELVLFVGSGASLDAGAPTWRALLHRLVEEVKRQGLALADGDDLDELLKGPPADLILAAGYLRDLLGADHFGHVIRDAFGDLQPQRVHQSIAKLHLAGIVTTNYDCLLEDALGPGWTCVLPGHALDLDERKFIVKLHGSCKPEAHKVVIAPSDYKDLLADQRLVRGMQHLYMQYTFLFIGFSLSDPDTIATLEPLTDIFGDTKRRHYALMKHGEIGPIRKKDLEKRLMVQFVPYSTPDGSHSEAVDFLDRLGATFAPLDSKRNVQRTLVAIGGRADTGNSTHVLVKESSESWRTSDGLPYMLPNMVHTEDPAKIRQWLSRELDVPIDCISVAAKAPIFDTSNKNPSLGDKAGLYRFQIFEVTLDPQVDGSASRFRTVGIRAARWMTLTELRAHPATMAVNQDPFLRLSDLFGSDLEDLPVSASLPGDSLPRD